MHSVIQTVDCLISLSVLWKALANKQDLVEKLHYIDTKVEVVMMTKLQGTWVLVVAKAVLDVALSVAASVILSLLLLAGDVEENPGPIGGIITTILYITLLDDMIIISIQKLPDIMHNVKLMSVHIDIDFDSIDTTELSKLFYAYASTA